MVCPFRLTVLTTTDLVYRNLEKIILADAYLRLQIHLKDRTSKTRIYRQLRSLVKLFISSFNGDPDADPLLQLLRHIKDCSTEAGRGIPVAKLLELSLLSYSLRNTSADEDEDVKIKEEMINAELAEAISACILQDPASVSISFLLG